MDSQKEFFEDLACSIDYWTDGLMDAVSNPEVDLVWTKNPDAFRRLGDVLRTSGVLDDCRTVARELLRGLIHSVLVTFDGGTALAEHVRLDIVDNNGRIFDKYLHELFYNALFETGQMGELS